VGNFTVVLVADLEELVLQKFEDRAKGVDGGLEGRVRIGELYLIFGGHDRVSGGVLGYDLCAYC
jgi:hypothetical protein